MDIFGLPLHPLIVHAAVVLVPLAALGALLVVAIPWVRTRYGGLTALFAVAATGSALAARFTGPALATELGLAGSARIARHQAYGLWMPWPVLLLLVALVAYLWAQARGPKALVAISGVVTVLASLISLVLIGLTGHAGATAVWAP